jgi:hypothetical protein
LLGLNTPSTVRKYRRGGLEFDDGGENEEKKKKKTRETSSPMLTGHGLGFLKSRKEEVRSVRRDGAISRELAHI